MVSSGPKSDVPMISIKMETMYCRSTVNPNICSSERSLLRPFICLSGESLRNESSNASFSVLRKLDASNFRIMRK